MMDAARRMSTFVDALDSKDTKRRLQGLDMLEESLRQSSPAQDSWQQVVMPLVTTLRDNNFKVCRASLACLEILVGHVDADIIPFLSTIIPAVIECLGNSKPAVQEKGIDFLLAVSSPAVNGARHTIAALDSYFRHKNWRVRERLVMFVGRAAEVDGAGVRERSVASLAGIMADALNDSACQVRQAALATAWSLVELTGESLLAQLEQRGVRNAQLASLRRGDCSSASTVPTSSASGREPVSPVGAATPAPLTKTRGGVGVGPQRGGNSSNSASKSLRQTAAERRLLRPAASGGSVDEAPTPAATRPGGSAYSSSPTTVGISPGRSPFAPGGGEESAFSALEPLLPVKVYTERDVRREVEAAKAGLEHRSDWQQWVGAMRRLAGVALGGAAAEFPVLFVGLVRASVQEMVGHKVSENRSAVAREACRCVAVLARCLTDHFGALAELWLPELLRNTTRAVVVAAAGDEAARAIFGCTTNGFPRLLPCLIVTARNKSAAIRCRSLDYAMLGLARWSDTAFDRYLPQIRDMVAAAVADADGSNRATARRAYWVFRRRFPELAQSIMDSLSASMQRHVLREDKEFDVEAFVKAAKAAAEDPQPALGEHPAKDQDVVVGGGPSSALNRSPNGHIPSSAPPRRAQHASHLSSTPTAVAGASASVPSGASAERTSYQPPRFGGSNATTVNFAGKSSFVRGNGSGNPGGAMRSERVKVDRVGVGSSGGGGGESYGATGGGAGGMRVARPIGGGTIRRGRGIALPQESANDDDTSIGSDGSSVGALDRNRAAGTAAGLRVRCGNATAFNGGGPTEAMVHHSGGSSSGSSDYYSATGGALRVARRVPSTVTQPGAAAVTDGKGGREGVSGGAGGGGAKRVAGRQLKGASPRTGDHQQQQRDTCGEGSNFGFSEALREVAGPAVLDRREMLRKVDSLLDQTGVSHWAARVEALEGLLEALTVEGDGEGGKFVLEHRSAARRMEAVIAERFGDAHFRVSSAALGLFGGLVGAHPGPFAGHVISLLPSVFPSLADTKDFVRQAASRALDACRAAYPSSDLCGALCPRVLDLAPGRARTGLLEFLAVLVPHSSSLFRNPGHMQALTHRVAAALVQSPPPAKWDGGLGDSDGGAASAGTATSAAIRLLTALFHVDRDAFKAAVVPGGVGSAGNLPPESAAALRQALSHSCSAAVEFIWPSVSTVAPFQQRARGVAAASHGGKRARVVSASARSTATESATPSTIQEELGNAESESESRVGRKMTVIVSSSTARDSELSNLVGSSSGRGLLGAEEGVREDNNGGHPFDGRIGIGGDTATMAVPSIFSPNTTQEREKQERPPLATVTPRHAENVAMHPFRGGNLDGNGKPLGPDSRSATSKPGLQKEQATGGSAVASKGIAAPVPLTVERDMVEVGRRLIAGLSPGARSYQKVEALSSLRGLADGEGVGGRAEFWPRYFGQVLTLLLDGAGATTSAGTSKISSRRRALWVKNLQGVRCLVARRGSMFVDYTEMVVERLVKICAGNPCVIVRYEVEACLADLVAVLDPNRFLAVLTSMLLVDAKHNALDKRSGFGEFSLTSKRMLVECIVLGALRALTPRLSSPDLLGALGARPLMAGLESALEGRDMEARKETVMVFVEMYQILEEALLPFMSGFSPCRLKLITMYIEQRRARDHGAAIDKERISQIARLGEEPGIVEVVKSPIMFRPIR